MCWLFVRCGDHQSNCSVSGLEADMDSFNRRRPSRESDTRCRRIEYRTNGAKGGEKVL